MRTNDRTTSKWRRIASRWLQKMLQITRDNGCRTNSLTSQDITTARQVTQKLCTRDETRNHLLTNFFTWRIKPVSLRSSRKAIWPSPWRAHKGFVKVLKVLIVAASQPCKNLQLRQCQHLLKWRSARNSTSLNTKIPRWKYQPNLSSKIYSKPRR